jgi:GT2 family glycosyltransferase
MTAETPLRPQAVCAITVTYASRFRLLHKTISALLDQGIGRILIVDNACHPDSRGRLERLRADHGRQMTVMTFGRSLGTAGAFSRALAYARGQVPECSHLWLLDDDLRPKAGALQKLLDYWQASTLADKRCRLCLAANRDSGAIYREAVFQRSPRLVLGPANGFWGFHCNNLLLKTAGRLRRRKARPEAECMAAGELAVAPYGGLFFHKDLLEITGYPREDYFLYVDDYDFTYRITQAKGSIQLVLASQLEDLQPTWETGAKGPHIWVLAGSREFKRIYYSARNLSHFLRQRNMTSIGSYLFNMTVFLALFSGCALLRGNWRAIAVMVAAMRDGLRGRLGENGRYA